MYNYKAVSSEANQCPERVPSGGIDGGPVCGMPANVLLNYHVHNGRLLPGATMRGGVPEPSEILGIVSVKSQIFLGSNTMSRYRSS